MAKSVLLSYIPVADSLHVYLNGVEQYAPQDYVVDGDYRVIPTTAMDARANDLLECRYAHNGEAAPVVMWNEVDDPVGYGACAGQPFPWYQPDPITQHQLVSGYATFEIDEAIWGNPQPAGKQLEYTITMADQVPPWPAFAWNQQYNIIWQKPDGCFLKQTVRVTFRDNQSFYSDTGLTLQGQDYSNQTPVPAGSILVAWEVFWGNSNGGTYYYRMERHPKVRIV